MHKNFTKTPNILFDHFLKELNTSELKILLVIIRQTNGWIDRKTKRHKERDRITYNQFISKTGLSRRIISVAINSLFDRQLIEITDSSGKVLKLPNERKGIYPIYYSPTINRANAISHMYQCKNRQELVQKVIHINRNYLKRNLKEEDKGYKHISEIIKEMRIQ